MNGSFCELPLIEQAKKMGLHVITTGNDPSLIGHKYSDEYIPCDYSDLDAVLNLVKENNIDGIISCANDFGVLTASYVADKMNWPGHDTYKNSVLLHHKDEFKKYCYEHNIPSPHSKVVLTKEEAKKVALDAEYPIIVKANDLTGGKGIMKASNYEEAEIAIDNAFNMSRDKHILIEPFIVGTQHTISTFVVNKKVLVSTACNCYSPINPYLIQSETFPADGIENHRQELCNIIESICEDLSLEDGIFALQYIMSNDKIYIIEMMRRPFGNQFLELCSKTTGLNWNEAHIKSQLGMDCSNLKIEAPEMKYCGHHGIMTNKNGVVVNYEIPDEIKKHVYKVIEMKDDNGEYVINDCNKERVAYIYYQYESKEEMNKAVSRFNDEIKVIYKE